MKIKTKKILLSIYRYFLFFVLTAFVVTCCVILFATTLSKSLGIDLDKLNTSMASKVTLVNVIVISFLLTLIDSIRRKMTVDRYTRNIIQATDKIMNGDFSARVPMCKVLELDNQFDQIATRINQMAKELQSVETLRLDFISNVSHELKTPLSVMQNYARLMSMPNTTIEQRQEYATAIIGACSRLNILITNILKLNKLENQQLPITTKYFDLSQQLCECLLDFEELIDRKHLDIESDIQDNIMIESDEELLRIVWSNLISNAIKFTEDSGKISVSTKLTSDGVIVAIKDSGCGMSESITKHIFDKFYQGDNSHSQQGNGLGLALVQKVLELTHCSIKVESKIGEGSTFLVSVPHRYAKV